MRRMLSAIEILNQRLARGEITIEEHTLLRSALADKVSLVPAESDLAERPIAEIKNACLFNDRLVHKGFEYLLSEVTSVNTFSHSQTFNFIPIERSTYLVIELRSGKSVTLFEGSIFFSAAKHTALKKMASLVQKHTFHFRLKPVWDTLKRAGRVGLARPTLQSPPKIFLTADGTVVNESNEISVRHAFNHGTLSFGTSRNALSPFTYSIDPSEIVISLDTPKGRRVPKNSICFTPNIIDKDIVHALFMWFAKGKAVTD